MPDVDIDIKKLGVGGVDFRDNKILNNLAPAVSKKFQIYNWILKNCQGRLTLN